VGYPLLLRLLGFYGFAAETPLYVRAALMKLGFWILIVAAQVNTDFNHCPFGSKSH